MNANPPVATAAITSSGVSTELLSTMLDQVVASNQLALSEAKQATSMEGEQLSTPTEASVSVPQSTSREYASSTQQSMGNYSPATTEYTYFASTMPRSPEAGQTASLEQAHIALQVTPTASALQLGGSANVAVGVGPQAPGSVDLPAAENRPLPLNEEQRFGHVVRQWGNGSQTLQLALRNGEAADQARLCWLLETSNTHRTQCYRWAVPAGWKHGDPLRFVGVQLEETTSDGTKLYWNSGE